jgi:gas vesicle protein
MYTEGSGIKVTTDLEDSVEDDHKLSYFFLGIGVGLAAGMLFAPKSGEETRALLRHKADEGRDYIKRRGGELRENAGDFIERGREAVSRQKEQLSSAVEAGRQAYRDARGGYSPEEQGV